jgi:Fe-S oxidoreductase
MDFGEYEGILAAAEKCSGSADCRKLHTAGGTMCPSYMATRDEKDSTRARANVLREFLIHSEQENPFAHQEIYDVMDLCLSCKGCKSECPSNVDMAALKAEFLHHYYKAKGIPLRTRAIANISVLNRWGMILPKVTNFLLENTFTSSLLKKLLGISSERSLPTLSKTSLTNLFSKNKQSLSVQNPKKKIFFFSDEFTDLNEAELGWKALELLATLGYETEIPEHVESGRAYLSKGLLEKSQILANRNFELLQAKISADTPLIGIEPSAILTFRDEFPKLVKPAYRERAKALSQYIFTVEEFLYHEMLAGNITRDSFVPQSESILLHGHCHQKVLSEVVFTKEILALAYPSVQIIPSGCCGMAGSFGYEKEHYEVSMKIGALVLFPAITQTAPATLIAASGTSCRHQIKDGTQRNALHPVEILWTALK